ncbi:MAG: DUF1684 domain-containing protein [Crocinitomicaceae bacterium]|nr:DUF1684 domain-containing protein [Crocinitomicaceae bacterium]
MKYLFTLLLITCQLTSYGQMTAEETAESRSTHLTDLTDPEDGLLDDEEKADFHGLDYFDFDQNYQVEATFIKDKGKKFQMETSTDRKPWYRRYGYAEFTIDGKLCRLELYQNIELKSKKEYKKYLFIPFKDGTSREETYGGGRFMDTEIPDDGILILDFNQAYNPYCAYSYRYSCPIPPAANSLDVEIRAGEKTPVGH